MTIYPASALRAVALRTQNLHTANGSEPTPTPDTLYQVINQIGCVQIDTLHMVRRSQYLVPWSRMGTYEPTEFDDLIFGPERRFFEGWEHAATIIPLAEYRYQMPHQRNLREHPTNWYNRWLNELVQKDFVPQVLERVRREGALKVSNFESDGHKGGTWWNWRPAKVALEFLYAFGELTIANRVKFQRVYDLTERVLPKWVDTSEPTVEERDRFWVERGAKALGVCLPRHAGDYTWMKVTKSRPIVNALVKGSILLQITGELADGRTADLVIHRDNLPLLEQASDGALKAKRTTFLSPFDNLFWAARRDEMFWGFHKSLEAYLPAPKRVYGYFCLPILHKDRLVGRFDPKLVRKTGTLILRALYLEPGIKAGEELVKDVASAMRDFMAFHEAKELVIERSEPAAFGKKLLKGI
ncbi:MAG: YcaQ family DNA glycosylase [Chloroflexi bacterium]|nr:YcaQ family DNA glycosylase [Chloroflexota bacterium]